MWTQVYLIFVDFFGQVAEVFFGLFINHLWMFIPFVVSFLCFTVSMIFRLIVSVANSDV